jgi:hypothetical protein
VIEISKHARQQWRDRADTPGLDPQLAWIVGVPLDRVPDFEEGRYHGQSETVLLRRGTTIVTVYDARDVTAEIRATIAECREATA